MKYVSIDIETTGLDPIKNKILSVAAIIEDTTNPLSLEESPKFTGVILQREIIGSPRAISMNKHLIESIGHYLESDDILRKDIEDSTGYKFYEESDIIKSFYKFLCTNGHGSEGGPITLNVAGKNFGTFDKLFLEQLPMWKKLIKTRQRIIDPSVLFCDWDNDKALPSLSDCKSRANLESHVSHDALDDAWDVITLLRKFYVK